MSKHHKEKHLQATIYRIENTIREQNFLLKNLWKVIGLGILFSFWAPTFRSSDAFHQKSESMFQKGDHTYTKLVVICGLTYIVLCFIYHFSSKYQNKKKLTQLLELKKRLEEEIQHYN